MSVILFDDVKCDLHHICEARVCLGQNVPKIGHDLVCLRVEISFADEVAIYVTGNLFKLAGPGGGVGRRSLPLV